MNRIVMGLFSNSNLAGVAVSQLKEKGYASEKLF